MSKKKKDTTTVEDNKEVLEFLQTLEETPTEKPNLLEIEAKAEIDQEEYDFLKDATKQEAEDRVRDVPEIPARDEFQQKPYQDLFSALIADLGVVTVADIEKDLFIKSILNDTQFITSSEILGGKLTIGVKSRTMYTDKFIFQALGYDEANGQVIGVETMMFKLQQYVSACQLASYGNKNVNLELDHTKPFEENHKLVNDHIDKVLATIPVHIWAAIVMGIRIHEYKSKLCMDNLNNENFWESAGIN